MVAVYSVCRSVFYGSQVDRDADDRCLFLSDSAANLTNARDLLPRRHLNDVGVFHA
jgi:hypothetical protein